MKNRGLLLLTSLLLILSSCSKMVEDKKKDVLIQIITNGQWHVESFLQGSDSITTQFDGYNFQFREDGSVTGTKDSIDVTGYWEGDMQNYSITSAFPNASEPLKKLNGIWKIKDSALDYVAAEMTTLQGIMILHLRKNS